jgi:hypothetical protein
VGRSRRDSLVPREIVVDNEFWRTKLGALRLSARSAHARLPFDDRAVPFTLPDRMG